MLEVDFSEHGKLLLPTPTPAESAVGLANQLSVRSLYLKLEGSLPTGTHKFRAAQAACQAFLGASAGGIVAASCGSYATALAYLARRLSIPTHLFLPCESNHQIESGQGVVIHEPCPSYEDAVAAASAYAIAGDYLNVTPGHDTGDEIVLAYAAVTRELLSQLPMRPTHIIVPVGNGTALAGIGAGVRRQREPNWQPRLVGAGIAGNALFTPHEWSAAHCENEFADLVGSEPLDAAAAARAVVSTRGRLVRVEIEDIRHARRDLLSPMGVVASLSSVAALAGAIELAKRGCLRSSSVVAIVLPTGRRERV